MIMEITTDIKNVYNINYIYLRCDEKTIPRLWLILFISLSIIVQG